MWFMNHITNPLVRLVLRSPLHKIMSATVLLFTYHGRKSGKEYTFPVQYVQDNRTIYIVVGMPEKKSWWRNLLTAAPVSLLLTGKRLSGKAEVLDGNADVSEIVHGVNCYLRRFPGAARNRNLIPSEHGSFNQDQIRQLARSTVMVRVTLDH